MRFAGQVLIANILGGALVLIQPIAILATSNETNLGVFSLLVSWANIGFLLTSLGFLTALQRLGSHYTVKSRNLEASFHTIIDRRATLNVLSGATGICLIAFILHRGTVSPLLYPAIFLSLTSLFYQRWWLIKCRLYEKNFWPNMFNHPAREGVFLALIIILYFSNNYRIPGKVAEILSENQLLIAYSIASLSAAIMIYLYRQKNKLFQERAEIQKTASLSKKKITKIWYSIAITSFPSELGIYLLKRIDVIIVSQLTSVEMAGLYFLFARFAEIPNLVGGAVNAVVGPEFAKLDRSKDMRRRIYFYLIAAVLPSITTAGLAAIIYAGIKTEWLFLLFDEKTNVTPIFIFLAGYFVYYALGPTTLMLTMTGGQKVSSLVTGIIVPTHLCLTYFMISTYGINGAAITFCISIISQRVIELCAIYRIERKMAAI